MRIALCTSDWTVLQEDPNVRSMTGPTTLGGTAHYRLAMAGQQIRDNTEHDVVIGLMCHREGEGFGVLSVNGEQYYGFDVVIMQRFMTEDLPDLIREARSLGQVIINDVDDWYLGIDKRNLGMIASDPRQDPRNNRLHYHEVLRSSSLVTVSTPFLRDAYAAQGCNTNMIRNAIDLDRWMVYPQQERPVRIGWGGTTATRSGDLEILKGTIGRVMEETGAWFHHAGYFPYFSASVTPGSPQWELPHAGELMGIDHEAENYTESLACPNSQWPWQAQFFDVGIVPLNLKPDFNRAKSNIKGMEYIAAGRPFVASASDEYRWLYDEYGVGTIIRENRAKAWHAALNYWVRRTAEERAEDARIQRERLMPMDITNRWKEWLDVWSGADA